MDADNKKPFKVKDVTRNVKKAIVASTLEEIKTKISEKFEKIESMPKIHLDSDGTEVDDEEYFRTLEPNTELIAVFPGEHWIDPTQFLTISSHHQHHPKKISSALPTTSSTPTTTATSITTSDSSSNGASSQQQQQQLDTTDAANAEADRVKKLIGQIKNNLCNVSMMSDPDLDSLSNMDPNSLVDITGKDFMMDQLKDVTQGRAMCAKREAEDRVDLLKLLIDLACRHRKQKEQQEQEQENKEKQQQQNILSKPSTSSMNIDSQSKAQNDI